MTAVFGFFILMVYAVGQSVVAVITISASGKRLDLDRFTMQILNDGDVLSTSLVIGAIIGTLLTLFVVWLKASEHVRNYLGLFPVTRGVLLRCLGVTALFIVAAYAMSLLLVRENSTEFMLLSYQSVTYTPLLWIGICLGAPLFEEVFFRGYLITGWEQTRLGPIGAVILADLAWTAIHVQYGWYELIQIFILGLLFGMMRIMTDSIVPAITCHVLVNVVATVETATLVGRFL